MICQNLWTAWTVPSSRGSFVAGFFQEPFPKGSQNLDNLDYSLPQRHVVYTSPANMVQSRGPGGQL